MEPTLRTGSSLMGAVEQIDAPVSELHASLDRRDHPNRVAARHTLHRATGPITALALAGLLLTALSPPAVADVLVREFSGSGMQTTRPFTVDGPWELQWQAQGYFMIVIRHQSGRLGVSDIVGLGEGSGSAYRPRSGTYFLEISGVGAWTVKVIRVGN